MEKGPRKPWLTERTSLWIAGAVGVVFVLWAIWLCAGSFMLMFGSNGLRE